MDSNHLSWKIIDKYFLENPNNLVDHHLDSYNHFFSDGIKKIFRENNPIRFTEKETAENKNKQNECSLYIGGKDGDKIYYGSPMIFDENTHHYMYPNDARLRNMTYGFTIHYDIQVDYVYYVNEKRIEESNTIEKIFLGRFPIMLQSNLCILKSLSKSVRFNMGECKNDYGGYFIIDGKEKVIVSQEKFANNMLYIRKFKEDSEYSYSAEIKSVSEDTSKQIRTTAIKMVAPSASYTNNQIVVVIPNVKKPIPLFILMRALGICSDKEIIEYCIYDIEKNDHLLKHFVPSIHDASKIFNQSNAINYIKKFTKYGTTGYILEILSDFFLPHVGELNLREKAYFVGYMVRRMLNVSLDIESPTDRDSFSYKRVELSGTLLNDLFREYYLLQKKNISTKIDKEYYYHKTKYKKTNDESENNSDKYLGNDFSKLIESNVGVFFKERIVESGFKKAFKGNWGSQEYTKRLGVVQDLNRLSWSSHISQLRKLNLPMDSTAKVVGPRHLHSSQWGFIDPVDTPDGGNIGFHKHLSIMCKITSGFSSKKLIEWLRNNTSMKLICDSNTNEMYYSSKIFINGRWIGIIDTPLETVDKIKLFRRNGIIPPYTSVSFDYRKNEIRIFTDSGRLIRPIYYIDKTNTSSERKNIKQLIESNNFSWEQIVSGFKKKSGNYKFDSNNIYNINEIYNDLSDTDIKSLYSQLHTNKSVIDYVDTAEEENALISVYSKDVSNYTTHIEIDPSLLFGVMGNQVIYPEYNQFPRDVFSCGQSRQAVSVFHTNYQNRIDKMSVILHYGQIPLIKSRYTKYVNNEENTYGVNTIVAIMTYTGYNVEDAILINEGSLNRGLFRTTYFTMYESHEEYDIENGISKSKFGNINDNNVIKLKKGMNYNLLDEYGMIKVDTPINDETILIGKMINSPDSNDTYYDESVKPKKGQLGFVDKTFITQGDEGTNIAKVRIREERIPAIGDKMASRAGQKGTIGLIIPERDMPFTKDGVKPDLIINPHAIPSRMTIGQILESLFGKICTETGAFGDCTAFQTKGSNYHVYKPILNQCGFHSSGNDVLYNGMTGEQISSDIYIGPTYYMRLKHMVKDKINYRAEGKRTMLTRQTVQGRANDGGLRIGEMERDCISSHGMTEFLTDSFLNRGDKYFMAICNNTGCVSIYNKSKNIFLSPFADGPINFHLNNQGNYNVENVSRFGRSFSIVRIPYTFKLLLQELQVMNIQMRIITDDNIDQITNMNYSTNINRLLNAPENETIENINKSISSDLRSKVRSVIQQHNLHETNKEKIDSNDNEFPSILLNSNKIDMNDNDDMNDKEESLSYHPDSGDIGLDSNSSNILYGDSESVYVPNNEQSSIVSTDSPIFKLKSSNDNNSTPASASSNPNSQTTNINAPNSTIVVSANAVDTNNSQNSNPSIDDMSEADMNDSNVEPTSSFIPATNNNENNVPDILTVDDSELNLENESNSNQESNSETKSVRINV